MHRHHRRGGRRYGHGLHGRRFPNREEWLRALEEHQRDLEQEIADVADLIRRLKDQPAETAEV
ncbi:MAG: hypothetical protein ACRDNR_05800 [Gaiellaceae bacterium]